MLYFECMLVYVLHVRLCTICSCSCSSSSSSMYVCTYMCVYGSRHLLSIHLRIISSAFAFTKTVCIYSICMGVSTSTPTILTLNPKE